LSYAWGDPAVTRPIVVHRYTLHVTENLEATLRCLKYRDRTRKLWADAICINQRDDIEKANQIRQMGDVFSKAATVLVWLGDASDDSDLAFDALVRLASSL